MHIASSSILLLALPLFSSAFETISLKGKKSINRNNLYSFTVSLWDANEWVLMSKADLSIQKFYTEDGEVENMDVDELLRNNDKAVFSGINNEAAGMGPIKKLVKIAIDDKSQSRISVLTFAAGSKDIDFKNLKAWGNEPFVKIFAICIGDGCKNLKPPEP